MASIKDVAKEAGVSVATVSRVINKSGVVTETTQKAVQDAIEKLGYRYNLFGRGLRSGETKIIMVMLSSLANTFCSSVIRSIDKAAGSRGYCTMVCTTDGLPEKEEYYTNFACNGLFDGMIILNSALSNEQMSELAKNIPVVQCNEFVNIDDVPYVSIDNEKAAYDAVSLLIANGRRRIVFHTVENNLVSTRERFKGYRRALEENSIPFDEELVLCGNYGYRNAVRVFKDYISGGLEFDGVFAISDRMAVGAARTLLDNGYKIPEDVEIVGFDNTDISYTSTPQITTVSQPHALLGRNAFELLEKVIGKQKTENIILSHKIVIRNSTK